MILLLLSYIIDVCLDENILDFDKKYTFKHNHNIPNIYLIIYVIVNGK
jgi:hypothetical protein